MVQQEERHLMQNEQPRGLECEESTKLVSTILAASAACQGSRLGNNSWKRVLFSACSSRWIRRNSLTRSRFGCLPGSCMDREGLDVFMGKYTVRNYRTEQSVARDKVKKSSDESPTDQEHRSGNQADQANRVQMEHLLRLPYLWWG